MRYNRIELRQDDTLDEDAEADALAAKPRATVGDGRDTRNGKGKGNGNGNGNGGGPGPGLGAAAAAAGAALLPPTPLSGGVRTVVSKIFDASALKSAMDAMSIDPAKM